LLKRFKARGLRFKGKILIKKISRENKGKGME